MNTAYFIVKESLAFQKYPKLCELQQKNDLDLGQNHISDVSCGRFVSVISSDMNYSLKCEVENTRFISLLSDRSTDAGILEEEIVYICLLLT